MHKKALLSSFLFLILYFLGNAQMRQVYFDNSLNNDVVKTSFYTAGEGYVAFAKWIGYTTDSGRTFTKKYISSYTLDVNGIPVVLNYPFTINGIQAFNQNNLLVYGSYNLIPSILLSTDGGNSFKLVVNSRYSNSWITDGVTDMIFPGNGSIGYAIDADRIFKSVDQGKNWSVVGTFPRSYFNKLNAPDPSVVFVVSDYQNSNQLIKSVNGGSTWQTITLPGLTNRRLITAFFLNENIGWISLTDQVFVGRIFKTLNGGLTWTLQNDLDATPFYCSNMYFTDQSTGYASSGALIYRTQDSGATWEPFAKDNTLFLLHHTLQVRSPTQLWAGGRNGFLELNTNGSGPTIPTAYFKIDTNALYNSSIVQLLNFSKPGYTCKWFLNNVQISTSYNASYTHLPGKLKDTIQLVISNGTSTDTAVKYQAFHPPVIVSGFSPATAPAGTEITITGDKFYETTKVSFGGVAASSFKVVSETTIKAFVGAGATGSVKVQTLYGQDSLAGFVFIPKPEISSIVPAAATAGTTIQINGNYFAGVDSIKIAGVKVTSFTVVSPTLITAVVPSGGSGNIELAATGGISVFPGFIAIPVIHSFTPHTGTHGTVMTIKGSSLSGINSVKIGGIDAQSFEILSADSMKVMVGTGASGNITISKPGASASVGTFSWVAAPVITSFSPASGPVGTSVIITGTGFSNIPADNKVFFGTVQATVTSSSSTSVTVNVPAGASFDPISVANNNLLAYADHPFLVTFNSGAGLTANSFTLADSIKIHSIDQPDNIQLADLDNDGKLDVVLTIIWDGIWFYRNTSTTSKVSFDHPTKLTFRPWGAFKLKDLDGDGKLDLTALGDGFGAIGESGADVACFRNISTPGSIAFEAFYTVVPYTGGTSDDLQLTDIDSDGKTDILFAKTNNLYAARNLSNPGAIMFAPAVALNLSGIYRFMLADFDTDKKPDIGYHTVHFDSMLLVRNISTPGNFNFAIPVGFPKAGHTTVLPVDLDADGKMDLVLSGMDSSQLLGYRNTSSIGHISFDYPVVIDTGTLVYQSIAADFDGDGKTDIATNSYYGPYKIHLYKNLSVPGNISVDTSINFINARSNYSTDLMNAGDVNGDGKPDILAISNDTRSVLILLNHVGDPVMIDVCPNGSRSLVSNITGASYQWQQNAGTGYVNISNNAQFSGTTSATLQLNSIPSSWYGYTYRCKVGANDSEAFELKFVNSYSNSNGGNWGTAADWSCGTVPDENTDVIVTSGNVVLTTNTTVRSLKINPGATVHVNPGVVLTIRK